MWQQEHASSHGQEAQSPEPRGGAAAGRDPGCQERRQVRPQGRNVPGHNEDLQSSVPGRPSDLP